MSYSKQCVLHPPEDNLFWLWSPHRSQLMPLTALCGEKWRNTVSHAFCAFWQRMKQMKFVKVRLLPSLARGLNYKLLILTQPAAWCFCSSCIVNSLLPSCIWLCTLAPRCGWWTALLGWSPWSALPPRCDILDTNTQKDYYIYYYMLKINSHDCWSSKYTCESESWQLSSWKGKLFSFDN